MKLMRKQVTNREVSGFVVPGQVKQRKHEGAAVFFETLCITQGFKKNNESLILLFFKNFEEG